MNREELLWTGDITQRMASDPEGMTLHGIMKHMMLVTMKHPLMKAVAQRDTDMMGEWARREYSTEAHQDEEAVELLADTVRRVLEAPVTPPDDAAREVLGAFKHYLDFVVNTVKEQSQKEMES